MEFRNRLMIALGRALEATTANGQRGFGWTRLATMRSRVEGKTHTYVIAARPSDKLGCELGCSCPHWLFRLRQKGDGTLCKHQQLFLAHQEGNAPRKGVWLYSAGVAFLDQFRKV